MYYKPFMDLNSFACHSKSFGNFPGVFDHEVIAGNRGQKCKDNVNSTHVCISNFGHNNCKYEQILWDK